MQILGWTQDQLAIAKAHYEDMVGEPVEPGLNGIFEVRRFWQKTRLYAEPGEFSFVEPRKSDVWAAEAFYQAITTMPAMA